MYKLYVRHEAETHENRQFLSTGMEFAENAYAYVLKAPSRSYNVTASPFFLWVSFPTINASKQV